MQYILDSRKAHNDLTLRDLALEKHSASQDHEK